MKMVCFVGDSELPVDPQDAHFLKHVEEAKQMDEEAMLTTRMINCEQKEMHFLRLGDIVLCCCDNDVSPLALGCVIDEMEEGQPFRNWLSAQLLKIKVGSEKAASMEMRTHFINSLLDQGVSGSDVRRMMDAIQLEPAKMLDGLFLMGTGHFIEWVNDYLDNRPELKRHVFSQARREEK